MSTGKRPSSDPPIAGERPTGSCDDRKASCDEQEKFRANVSLNGLSWYTQPMARWAPRGDQRKVNYGEQNAAFGSAVSRIQPTQQPRVTPLMSKDLTDLPGKEGLMITVEYPPGGSDPVHRHNAHGFLYVLEGSVVMQVKGGKEITLTPGESFYEGPDDVHVVGRNASGTKPAKFLVFLIKGQRRSCASASEVTRE
jgi:quercetin dioxygenase-like cupin family protein